MDPFHLRIDPRTGEHYDRYAISRALAIAEHSSPEFILHKVRLSVEILQTTKGRRGFHPRHTHIGLFFGFASFAQEHGIALPPVNPLELFERFEPTATSETEVSREEA